MSEAVCFWQSMRAWRCHLENKSGQTYLVCLDQAKRWESSDTSRARLLQSLPLPKMVLPGWLHHVWWDYGHPWGNSNHSHMHSGKVKHAALGTRAVPTSAIQDKQRSAQPWSRLPLWFAVGNIFLCSCKYSALFCLSHPVKTFLPIAITLHCALGWSIVASPRAELAAPWTERRKKSSEHQQFALTVDAGTEVSFTSVQMVSGTGCDCQDASNQVKVRTEFR